MKKMTTPKAGEAAELRERCCNVRRTEPGAATVDNGLAASDRTKHTRTPRASTLRTSTNPGEMNMRPQKDWNKSIGRSFIHNSP